MPTINDNVAKANKQIADINANVDSAQKLKPLTPITPQSVTGEVDVMDTIGADSALQTTPDQLSVTAPKQQDQFAQQQQQAVDTAQMAEASSFEALVANALNAPTESQIEAEQYKQQGVDEKQLRVDQLQTELITEADRLRTFKENILAKGGGLKSGAAAEIANQERASYAKQADIALVQLAAQDQLDYATTVADRAVDAMFSRQEKINEILGLIYNRNKSQFDKEEQRLFETKQADRNRRLDAEKDQEKLLQSTKIEALKMAQLNGAPQSVIEAIGSARNAEEVLVNGGHYASGDLLDRMYKQAQIANIYDTINQRTETERKAALEAETKQEEKQQQTKADTEQALSIQTLASGLLNDPGLNAAVGFGFKKNIIGGVPFVSGEAVAGTSRADFEANAQRLANMLTLDNLDLMSGVLSETDIKILESAGSNLGNFNMSEAAYKKEIQRVYDVASRTIQENGLTEEQAAFWGIATDDDLSEINSIYGTN